MKFSPKWAYSVHFHVQKYPGRHVVPQLMKTEATTGWYVTRGKYGTSWQRYYDEQRATLVEGPFERQIDALACARSYRRQRCYQHPDCATSEELGRLCWADRHPNGEP